MLSPSYSEFFQQLSNDDLLQLSRFIERQKAMTKKTKFETKDTAKTKATFTTQEVRDFVTGSYSEYRRQLYLEKMAARPPNPRLLNGAELLSDISMLADVDMTPLSMRQNLSRFTKMPSHLMGDDGYDTETPTDDQGRPLPDHDADFHSRDRDENPPSPHEVRAYKLSQKLSKARKAQQKALDDKRAAGATPAPEPTPQPAPAPLKSPENG